MNGHNRRPLHSPNAAQMFPTMKEYRLQEKQIATIEAVESLCSHLDGESERYLLSESSGTHSTSITQPQSFVALFAQQVQSRPEAIALSSEQGQLSYGELDRRANQLAHYLQTLGVGPEIPVGLCLSRSPHLLIGLLAVLKAGGTYLPLDPTYPAARLQFMLADAQVPVLLTQRTLLSHLGLQAGSVLCLDELVSSPDLASYPVTPPTCACLPQQLAYIIYTSGSTGRPKGTMITHRSWANLILTQHHLFGAEAFHHTLQFSSVCFDASIWEIGGALASGGTLHMLSQNPFLLGPDLLKIIQEQAITITLLPPSLLLALPDATLPHLTTLVTGGEACSAKVVDRWAPGRRFFNAYGPTEATVCATVGHCQAGEQKPLIGHPLINVEVYVLDEALEPVQVEQPGELYIGGIALARGYLGQPALTAERFIPHPFSDQPGNRLYRTGDLVRYQPGGSLEYVGRVDEQVKLRGFRIELGEIEQVLLQQPGVRQAVVTMREDEARGKQLVGYVVAQEGFKLWESTLKEALSQQLPEYMIPSSLTMLDALPLSTSGKIDRRALPAPKVTNSTLETGYIAPRNAREYALAAIWKEVMGVERVSIEHDFFEYGGHSLLAMTMISRIRESLGVDIPLQIFFGCRTIARLAEAIETVDEENAIPELQPRQQSSDVALASFNQQRLWFLDQLKPGLNAYNIAFAAFLTGNLRQDCLRSSLEELIKRHEVLRTTFELREGDLVQRVGAPGPVALSLLDLRELPIERRRKQALLLVQEHVHIPFDLQRGPLFRAMLIQLDEEEHLLLLTLHHIITDGWSQGILLRELAAGYEAALQGRLLALPPLPIQFADYTVWQRKWMQGERLNSQLVYWQQQLTGAPQVLELPTDRPRPPVQLHHGASLSLPLTHDVVHLLRQVSQREGVTPFMLLLSAFAILIARMSGQDDFLLGIPIAGRTRRALEDLVGFFVNTLPLRLQLHGQPTGRQLLERVREMTLQAYAHQEVPFEQIVEALQPQRDLSLNPLLQVFFAFDNTSDVLPSLPGLSLTPVEELALTAHFDLTLSVTQRVDEMHLQLEYDTDLFDQDNMQRLLQRYPLLLTGLLTRLDQPVALLPWMLEPERLQLLTQEPHSDELAIQQSGRTLLDIFDEQVQLRPEAIALSSEQGQLSYGELDRRANQLAHYLQTLSVGPEIPVGLCLSRSPHLLIGLLAVLKAGGTYLPLDPTYPAARLQFMLADAQAPVLLTQRTLLSHLGLQARAVLCLDELVSSPDLASYPVTPPTCACLPQQLAYIIYTSGSTGQPKGVMIPHRAIPALVWHSDYLQIVPEDHVAQTANTSFDAAIFEIWGALLNGAQLSIVPREVLLLPEQLVTFLHVEQISILFLTTALFNQVAQHQPGGFSSLRCVLFGGEAADPASVRRVLAQQPPARLINAYGPTENTTYSTWYAIEHLPAQAMTVPIGVPLAYSQAYILDAALQPVPAGVPGELYVGGSRLARGYLGRPSLTAERFVPHPFSTQPGERLYRTGDLARARTDGVIEFLGRRDAQVKLR
ncbi:MAG TPA: amino acid adenylation domain-containing protein, partial [Ktedonobacteraceae bacterium]|nr:amino acid adenylation domain-containing protein [Ktedonobacteraceae bacterium]